MHSSYDDIPNDQPAWTKIHAWNWTPLHEKASGSWFETLYSHFDADDRRWEMTITRLRRNGQGKLIRACVAKPDGGFWYYARGFHRILRCTDYQYLHGIG